MQTLALAEARAPRYTSYPTAAQFVPIDDASLHQRWLQAVPPDASASLYLHIPYCRRLCWYCGCNTGVANERAPVANLSRHLLKEIDRTAATIGARLKTKFMHFGGGSPDVLAKRDLGDLFTALRRRFDIVEDAEIAVELDPANVKYAWVKAAAENGVNRASLGVQTFAPHVQAAINRPQSPAVIENAVSWLRASGIRAINFDLMYGLPRQTTADVLSTIERALLMRPDRLAVFGYAHVPWAKKNQRLIDAAELPGAAARLEQNAAAAERLVRAGYVQIGLDHFALPHDALVAAQSEGRLHRNFQGYTTDAADVLLAFGPSAISRLPCGYVQNTASTREWLTAVSQGRLTGARGIALTQDDRFRAGLIERLMCEGRLDLADMAGAPPSFDRAGALQALDGHCRQGLLTRSGDAYVLTQAGWPLVRIVCAALDAYLVPEANRHAHAV